MNSSEKDLLRLIKRYNFNQVRLAETEERLESRNYKITPSYSGMGGGSGGKDSHSKVEDYAVKTLKLKQAAAEYRRQIKKAEAALNCPELSVLERRLLHWIAAGERPAGFAEREGIYISRVYKIRDKALRKALRSAQNTK